MFFNTLTYIYIKLHNKCLINLTIEKLYKFEFGNFEFGNTIVRPERLPAPRRYGDFKADYTAVFSS